MKKLLLILFVVLFAYPLLAQEETVFSGKIESGGYGGPLMQTGQILDNTGFFLGGQGGWIINHRFVLGGKGYALINDIDIDGADNLILDFGCGGFMFEYIISSDKLVHYSIQSMIGFGGVRYDVKDASQDHDDLDYSEDGFFVLEPGGNIIVNLSKGLRLGAGASYRYVNGVDYGNLSNSDLSGASLHLFLKIGEF